MAASTEPRATTDPVREATNIIMLAVSSAVTTAIHRAEVCGCRGCQAQAMEAAEWARGMLETG
jgi:hypothetical protein